MEVTCVVLSAQRYCRQPMTQVTKSPISGEIQRGHDVSETVELTFYLCSRVGLNDH